LPSLLFAVTIAVVVIVVFGVADIGLLAPAVTTLRLDLRRPPNPRARYAIRTTAGTLPTRKAAVDGACDCKGCCDAIANTPAIATATATATQLAA
jgi:hypothetical protein